MRGPRGAGDRRDPAPAAPLTPAHLLGRLGAAPPPRPAAGQVPQRQDAHLHLQSEKALLTQPLRGAAPAPGQRSRHQREARGARQLGASLPGSGEGAAGGSAPLPRRAGGAQGSAAPARRPQDIALQSGQSGAARRGAPAVRPANQRAGRTARGSGARDGSSRPRGAASLLFLARSLGGPAPHPSPPPRSRRWAASARRAVGRRERAARAGGAGGVGVLRRGCLSRAAVGARLSLRGKFLTGKGGGAGGTRGPSRPAP